MNKIIKTAVIALLLISSQNFFAQQVTADQKAQELELKRAENEAKKTSSQYHKMLDDKISNLKKELKDVESKKKNLVRSENDLNATKEKISKLELANQKIETKINTSSISNEEMQKQRVKTTENELTIQKLKLSQITQQKELEKAMSQL